MITLNGKYNYAHVFLPKDLEENLDGHEVYKYLDIQTQVQIESFLNHPGFRGRKIRVMPDTHFGKGSCVGFTMDLGDIVIPNIVGVDIGCGIRAIKLPFMNISMARLDDFIRKNIPIGFKIHENPVWNSNEELAYQVNNTADNLNLDRERIWKSVGTLGGGNHFIELGIDSEGYIWLTVHSGSRNFGLQVAKHYQKMADDLCWDYFQDFGDLNFIPSSSVHYDEYLNDMEIAQMYAAENRKAMSTIIVEKFFETEPLEVIDSVHNYVDFHDGIVRKGATPARAGQKLVIPFNMEDGLIIATGKGNKDWNESAPHGAGRILSRGQAKKLLDLEDTRKGMQNAGVFTTSLSPDTLDEAKGAYKSMDLILDMIQDTVTVDTLVKPVYNLKAGEKTE